MDKSTKNKAISQSIREPRNKRKSQVCKCFKFKIDKSNLSKEQLTQIKMQLFEAKWIYK